MLKLPVKWVYVNERGHQTRVTGDWEVYGEVSALNQPQSVGLRTPATFGAESVAAVNRAMVLAAVQSEAVSGDA